MGIIAGVLLSITSRYITTHLGMHTDVYSDQEDAYPTGKRRLLQQGRHIDEMGDYEDYSLYGDDAAASTSDLDRPWLADLSSPSPTRRRLASSGLLSQTIHEEDSDDGSDAVL